MPPTPSDPSPAWFRKCFNEDYCTIYSGRGQAEAETEVAFVVRALGIERGEMVLDLCCGFGRHLEAFGRRGIRAVGADLSLALLRQAAPRSARRVVCADMRQLPFRDGAGGFSVVVNLFTSFGYFETEEENLRAAREMGRVLRPGGRFAMDLHNAVPVMRHLTPRTERRAGPFHLIEERRYDARRRRIEKRVELHREEGGRPCVKEYFESVRLYAADEIAAMLAGAGLAVTRLLGDFTGQPYSDASPRMIVLGRKPDGGTA
jgi:SAM-dependent methyltransferase